MSKRNNNAGTVDVGEVVRAQGEWKRRWQEAQDDADQLRAERDAILNVSGADFAPVKIKHKPGSKDSEATAMLVCSDWHVFERVRKEEVNGLNEYNASIAAKSIENLFQTALRLVEIERGAVTVPTLIVALLGDLMTGQLHPDQQETNDGTPQEEMLFLVQRIVGGLDMLLAEGGFESIVVPCCDGNHGRATDKLRSANRVKHSNEWLLYCLLARHYAHEPRIRFSIADGTLHYLDLYGRTVRLTHGDSIRYQGGIGGLTIPARKAVLEWDRARRADFTIFAHWHTSLLDKMFLANGSTLGYSPYAVTIKAAFEPPAQSFLLLNQQRWLLSYRPIYVR